MKSAPLLLAVALAVGATGARAQSEALPTLVPLQGQAEDAIWRAIELKNVKPSLMAYWLDPAHNALPQPPYSPLAPASNESAAAKDPAASEKAAAKTASPEPSFELPAGVTRLVPFDAQTLLLVKGGDAEDFRQLQELTRILDQPLRQAEIEVQFVELPAAELSAFGIEQGDLKGPQVRFLRGNFQARLNALVAGGRAKIIAAPRATLINNMEATLSANQPDSGDNSSAPPNWSFTVTPTINGDDTITLLSHLSVGTDAAPGKPAGLTTIVNLRDGDTVALPVASSAPRTAPATAIGPALSEIPTIGQLFRAKAPAQTLVFVTARIIRREQGKLSPANYSGSEK